MHLSLFSIFNLTSVMCHIQNWLLTKKEEEEETVPFYNSKLETTNKITSII